MKLLLCIHLMCFGVVDAEKSAQTPSIDAWYTQIGAWHHQKDSLFGKSFIYHDADLDGLSSGQATSNVRLNRGFNGLNKFIGRMCLGPAPAMAGLLVKNKKTAYIFLIKKENQGSFLQISRRDKKVSPIFETPFSLPDTFELCLVLKKDSLIVSAEDKKTSIARPKDLSGRLWVGFECLQGAVKVFGAEAASDSGEIRETFEKATLMNLHLEKMFAPKKN